MTPVVFPKKLSNAFSIFNEILANSKLSIDTVKKKNVLKFSETSQVVGGEGLKVRLNFKNYFFFFTF